MALTLTDEQQELAASVRSFLADKAPSEAVRRWAESAEGIDPAVWRQMAGQLGLQGLAIPEEYGGSGFGPAELGIVCAELGRALLPGPFFGSVVLAGQALTASRDAEAMRRWLPGIAAGSLTATLAVSEGNGPNVTDPATTATPAAGRCAGARPWWSTATPPTCCWSWPPGRTVRRCMRSRGTPERPVADSTPWTPPGGSGW